jgi:hypothetical protein
MLRSSWARALPDCFTTLLIVIEGFAQAAKSFSRRFKERLRFGIADASNIPRDAHRAVRWAEVPSQNRSTLWREASTGRDRAL